MFHSRLFFSFIPLYNHIMEANNTFFSAVKGGSLPQVRMLVEQNPALVNARDGSGVSAVLLAVYYGHPEIADYLNEMGYPLNIFEAAALGRLERVTELVSTDPTLVNAYAPDGFQPLGLASFFGHTEVARYLLARDAEVNSPSRNGQQVMPLHSAAAGGHLEIVKLLVDAGADVNAVQQDSFTPLHAAAENGQIEMIRLLLAHGADPNKTTADGRSAVDFARAGKHGEAVTLLAARGA